MMIAGPVLLNQSAITLEAADSGRLQSRVILTSIRGILKLGGGPRKGIVNRCSNPHPRTAH